MADGFKAHLFVELNAVKGKISIRFLWRNGDAGIKIFDFLRFQPFFESHVKRASAAAAPSFQINIDRKLHRMLVGFALMKNARVCIADNCSVNNRANVRIFF